MSEHIKTSAKDGVLEITFARPDKKNALSDAMYRAASDALEAAQSDAAIRVVLFSSEGDAFTAGNDLADFAKVAGGGSGELQASRFIRVLAQARKPLEKPLGAVIATKQLMRESEAILARLAQEGAVFGERLKSAEAREAFRAFAEKRPPDFTKLAS